MRSTEGTSIGGRGKEEQRPWEEAWLAIISDLSGQWGLSTLRVSCAFCGWGRRRQRGLPGQLVKAKLQRSRCWFSLSERKAFDQPTWPLGKSAKETKVAAGWQGYCSHLGERSWWLRLERQSWDEQKWQILAVFLKVELKGFVNQLDVLCDREEKKTSRFCDKEQRIFYFRKGGHDGSLS